MPNEFVARNGVIALNDSQVTGSLKIQGVTDITPTIATTNHLLKLSDNVNGTARMGFSSTAATGFFIGSNNALTIGRVTADNSNPSTTNATIVLNTSAGASKLDLSTNSANTGISFSDGNNGTIRMNFPSANETALTTISTHNLSIGVASGVGSLSSTTMKFFQSTSNVAIGTTSDSGYKLDVNGTARVQEILRVERSTISAVDIVNSADSYRWRFGIDKSNNTTNVFALTKLSGGNAQPLQVYETGNVVVQGAGNLFNLDVASAALQVSSTTRGFLPPRMTTAQRIAISTPAAGLIVYDTGSAATEGVWVYETTGWQQLLTNSGSQSISGSLTVNGTTTVTGSLNISGSENVRGSGSAIFTVDGTSGRLFSVDDSLSGSLFSVNTAAGLPVVEAFSDNTVRIGQYGQRALFVSQSRVGIGKETALNAVLDVSGSTTMTGSLTVGAFTSSFAGPVGIGTTSPAYTLDVNGTARIVNTLTVSGTGNNVAIQFSGGRIDADGTFIRIKSPGNNDMVNIAQNFVGINATSVTTSAIFEVASTTRGFLTPRMTAAQRTAISAPSQGLQVYDNGSTTEGLWYYNSGSYQAWTRILNSSGSQVITGSLTLVGNEIITGSSTATLGYTGSLQGTASWASNAVSSSYALNATSASYTLNATSASYAATSSYATNFTVAGTLTAQTLVVQTITSSTDFVTGSTRFGSLLANTHQFTGSVSMTGSLTTVGTASFNGPVGIGTTTPSQQLEVAGDALIRNTYVGYISAFGTNYASLSHTSRTGTGDYSLLSENNGTTYLNASTGQNIRFRINNNDKAVLDSSGNFGIGTTSPSNLFEVNGISAVVNSYGAFTALQASGSTGYRWTLANDASFRLQYTTNGFAGLAGTPMYVSSSGNIGIGTTTPGYPLHVNGNVSDISIYASNDIVAYSDQSVKTNLEIIPNAIDKIKQINGYTFERTDNDNKRRRAGVIAQEVEKILPEVIAYNADGTLGVAYGNMVALLIECIKEQQIQIDELKSKINGITK